MVLMPAAKRNLRTRANAEIPATGRPSARVAHAALDARLDLALIGTFPASDPVAIGHTTGTEPPSRPVERGPVTIDVAEIERVRRHPERAPES
jgi:hypothetical protein